MSKRESKKEHILSSGIEVMKRRGYNGTSVKDIVDAASVPKGSFYNYFESKELFAIEALESVACESYAHGRSLLKDAQGSPLERLTTFFKSGFEWVKCCDYRGGCFFGNMCQEMADHSEEIRLKIRGILSKKTSLIAEVIEEAQRAGEINSNQDPLSLAEFLFNAWEGAIMRMKASKSEAPSEAFLNVLKHL